MNKLRRYICMLCVISCIVMTFAITCYAVSGESSTRVTLTRGWSAGVTFQMPGFNGSRNTVDHCDPTIWVHKASDDTSCTFNTTKCESKLGTDGRIINSNGYSRSAWVRDLAVGGFQTGELSSAAQKGYMYYAEISSDLLEIRSFEIKFSFSPDDLT